jgi:hypothetical protein
LQNVTHRSADAKANEPSKSGRSGFAEQQGAFETASLDQARFNQSLALMRSFALIENDADRQKLLDLACQLAGKSSD